MVVGMIGYWLVGDEAQWPERHAGVALDLKARIPRGWRLVWGFVRIPLGVALCIPDDEAVRITGRSGNFLRGIVCHDGLVESEFNGRELSALLYCPWPHIVRHGQRIVQMWASKMDREAFLRLGGPPEDLVLGKRGFGSTGSTDRKETA